ncbi:MAG: hypothetical protein QW614_04840 [Candidatus Caldarchaeum sp.]
MPKLGYALGIDHEMHAAAYIQVLLEELGYPSAKGWALKTGKVLEIDVFCDDPVDVGGVATKLNDEKRADEEITKLLDRVEALSSKYGRKPILTTLSVGVAPEYLVERSRWDNKGSA